MEGPELGGGNWGTEQGAGAGKPSEGGHSRGARAGGGGSELEAAGVQSWRGVVRPRADRTAHKRSLWGSQQCGTSLGFFTSYLFSPREL